MPKLDPNTKKPEIPPAYDFLWEPAPIKIAKGGRGKAASWSIGRVLIHKAHTRSNRLILCTREVQDSIKNSVHRLLKRQITQLGLGQYFNITNQSIKSLVSGSEFIFKGLNEYSVDSVKSLEGATDVWLAEAQSLSKGSWEVLEPTIREDGSEIFIDYNPDLEEDFLNQYFVLGSPPPGTIIRHLTYKDNPFFPAKLEAQRAFAEARATDQTISSEARAQAQLDYDNIWLGETRKISQAAIFRSRVLVHDFVAPQDARFYFGADFGFSEDPATLIRMYITTNPDGSEELWIDYEAYGHRIELDDLPAFYEGGMSQDGSIHFTGVPGARNWPIKADNSRPETISYLARKGFMISEAKKWAGSVEDGITHVKAFRMVHIHTRCVRTQEESRKYCYKVDKAGNILPVVIDAWNHCWDAVRYGLDDFISGRGGVAQWERLGEL